MQAARLRLTAIIARKASVSKTISQKWNVKTAERFSANKRPLTLALPSILSCYNNRAAVQALIAERRQQASHCQRACAMYKRFKPVIIVIMIAFPVKSGYWGN